MDSGAPSGRRLRRLRLLARIGHDLARPLERRGQISGQILVAEAVEQSGLLQNDERLRMYARQDESRPSPLRLRLERLEGPEAGCVEGEDIPQLQHQHARSPLDGR